MPLEERDIATLTPEESRELIRRLRERNEVTQPIKQEGVKREGSATLTVSVLELLRVLLAGI